MKNIEVCSAIIIDENKKIFVAQRSYGEYKDYWEFPGGKIEPNESKENCIIREIKEELDVDIKIVKLLDTIEYQYPTFHIKMHNFIVKLENNNLKLLEHESAKYIDVSELDNIDFLPADFLIIDDLKSYIKSI